MDDLLKALKCHSQIIDCALCNHKCDECEYKQETYELAVYEPNTDILNAAYDRIVALEKSNRNWRRKAQRARKKYHESINIRKD